MSRMPKAMEKLELKVKPGIKATAQMHLQKFHFADMSEYFSSLVRELERRRAQDELDRLVAEAEMGGPDIEGTPDYVASVRKRITAKINALPKKRTRS